MPRKSLSPTVLRALLPSLTHITLATHAYSNPHCKFYIPLSASEALPRNRLLSLLAISPFPS